MSDRVISTTGSYTGYDAAVSIDAANDFLLIQQSGSYKKISRNVILGVTGTPADLTTVQTVQNKVLDNTNTITLKDTLFTLQDDGDTTKQAKFQLSGITTATTRTYTLPNNSSTLMDLATAQTVTGVKTLTAPVISGGSIDNATITVDAIGEHTAANGVTVDGLNIKDGKLNTNNSVVTANITDLAVTAPKLAVAAITLGQTAITTNFVSLTTAVSDVTNLAVTVTVPSGGRAMEITLRANVYNAGATDTVMLNIQEGATILDTSYTYVPAVNRVVSAYLRVYIAAPTAGSHTYKVTIDSELNVNFPAIQATATQPASILVKMI